MNTVIYISIVLCSNFTEQLSVSNDCFFAQEALEKLKQDRKMHQDNMSVKSLPPQPHFYIAKLGYGLYPFFSFLLQNIDCGYSLEPPRQRVPTINVLSKHI